MKAQSKSVPEWSRRCAALTKQVLGHKFGWVFGEPVNPIKLNIPDYFDVIKKPMDLGTVKTKAENGAYSTPDEFEADSRLTFNNALSYNPPGSDVHSMTLSVQELFEKKWNEVRDSIYKKFEETNGAIEEGDGSVQLSKMAKAVKDKDREMSFEDKRQLSFKMNLLTSKKLGKVVEVIYSRHPDLIQVKEGTEGDEVEIDLDKVTPSTLRFLEKYVAELQVSKKKEGDA